MNEYTYVMILLVDNIFVVWEWGPFVTFLSYKKEIEIVISLLMNNIVIIVTPFTCL